MGSPLQGLGLSAQLQGVKPAVSQALMPQTARDMHTDIAAGTQAARWGEMGVGTSAGTSQAQISHP